MSSHVLEHEIHEQLEHLLPVQQRQVLEFARGLRVPQPCHGRNLLPLAGTISSSDLDMIAEAVVDCEQVDVHGW